MRTGLDRGRCYCHFPFYRQNLHLHSISITPVISVEWWTTTRISHQYVKVVILCKVFMLELYKVITEAISVTTEISGLWRHYTRTDTMGKTDISFQHNTHTSGGVNVSTYVYSDVRVKKLVRMSFSCNFVTYPLNCRLRRFLDFRRR